MSARLRASAVAACALLPLAACHPDDTADPVGGGEGGFALATIVIDPDGRTTYLQRIDDPREARAYDHSEAVEIPGHGVLMVRDGRVFVGLAEAPEWVRFEVDETGRFVETGRLSMAAHGLSYVDYGYAFVDDDLAVTVSTEALKVILWDPETMEITGTIDLPHLQRDGYELEVWTTLAHDGLLYIPARWANWNEGRVLPGVSTTIVDPRAGEILGVAEDDRCTSGGRAVFDAQGYAYVMGDGRNYAAQMYAHAAGEAPPTNCLLRIPPGEFDFDEDFHVAIPDLTGGLESVTELEFAMQGSGVAFSKMFYPDRLPEGVEPVDFSFWDHPAFRMWRIELGDEPVAEEVEGVPFGALGFEGSPVDGGLFVGESTDAYATTTIYEIDPTTNTATERFSVDGLFYELAPLATGDADTPRE